MLDPVGPLPAAVYWRRRLVAIAVTTTVVILLGWTLGALVARPGAQVPDRAAVSEPQSTVPAPASAPVVVVSPDVVTPDGTTALGEPPPDAATSNGATSNGIAPGGIAPGGPTPGATSAASDTADTTTTDGVPASTSERVFPDDTPRAQIPVPPAEPLPPTGPVECTNEMLQVGAEVAEPEHRVGQRPTFRLVVVNISAQPCVRDLDGVRQEIVVWSADLQDRLWSSNDCINPDTDDLRTLVPGQPVAFSVRWAGRTTTPGCREERTTVPPGDYQIMTRIDDLISAPTPFRRLP